MVLRREALGLWVSPLMRSVAASPPVRIEAEGLGPFVAVLDKGLEWIVTCGAGSRVGTSGAREGPKVELGPGVTSQSPWESPGLWPLL